MTGILKQRVERLALQIQREVSGLLRTEVKDPRIGFVTVTRVQLSSDYSYAKVHVSILGEEAARLESLAALERAKGFIRGEVGRRIRMRLTPEIQFVLDESLDYSERIGQVLQGLATDRAARAPKDDREEENDGA